MNWKLEEGSLGVLFVSRDKEKETARQTFLRPKSSFNALYIYGERGVGKTAFLMNFIFHVRDEIEVIRLVASPDNSEETVRHVLSNSDPDSNKTIVLAIDDADIVTPEIRLRLQDAARNYKRCRGVIFCMERPPYRVEQEARRNTSLLEIGKFSDTEASVYLRNLAIQHDLSEEFVSLVLSLSNGNPGMIRMIGRSIYEGVGIDAIKAIEISGNKIFDVSDNILIPTQEIITTVQPEIIIVENQLIEKLKNEPEAVYSLKPREFEEVIADLLDGMGYKVTLTPQSGDGGKDIIAEMNTDLGKILCLVEAKKYRADRKIGVELVRTLYGTVCHNNASSGMLVTSSSFTAGAEKFQLEHEYQITLKDYADVAKWLMNHGQT